MIDLGQAHVIIVEDNQNNSLVIIKLLKLVGVRNCSWYPSGRAVVTYIQVISAKDAQQRPDLILLDIGLPGEDGYQILTRLRADPKLRGTRVVAVTARAYPEEMQQAKAAGFDGFIGKPIDAHRFPDQIRRIFNDEGIWEI